MLAELPVNDRQIFCQHSIYCIIPADAIIEIDGRKFAINTHHVNMLYLYSIGAKVFPLKKEGK